MIALDSSVIVAALSSWHGERDAALAAIDKAMASRKGIVVPAHALFEAYSVLTRMPPPRRLSTTGAIGLLRDNFSSAVIAMVPTRSIWGLVEGLASGEMAGGIIYDAVILASAESAGASTLLTLNPRDFERFNSHIRIVVP